MTLRVHSIESFSTADGRGIRYVIFLQGCSFRCAYCHNPDAWNVEGGTEHSIERLFEGIERTLPYLTPNRGGVTLSGGEPLEQAEAARALFLRLKTLPITRLIDTAGYALDNAAKALLKETDYVLLDMKQPIPSRHTALTGMSNTTVLEFQDYLDEKRIPYRIRFTAVEGLTDDKETLRALKERLKGRVSLEGVDVLPYHTLGKHKWELLGIPYTLCETKPLSKERKEAIEAFLKR